MNINKKPTFFKNIKKISNSFLNGRIEQAVLSVQNAQSPKDIPNLKKMKGYKIHYRIKIGRYRIGIEIVGDTVTFTAFGPRNNFYNFFP